MAHNAFSLDAWTRARDRFVDDLSQLEKETFFQATPQTILYDASAAEKVHGMESTTRLIVSKIQPFVEAVQQYGEVLDVYSSTYPLILGPLWGSIRLVLLLAREFGKYFKKLVDMFSSISNIIPRLQVYERLFPDHERLIQAMSAVYFDVLHFCSDAKKVFRRGKRSMISLVWKPFERQFGSLLQRFEEHKKIAEKEVSISHMIEAADSRALIRTKQDEISKDRYDAERLRIFSTLSSIDYNGRHEILQQLRFSGTGEWLVRHPSYVSWKQSTTFSGLCCHGIPGSGKSVLTSLIVDEQRQDAASPGLVYHYCDYADPVTLQPTHILRALMQQLFLQGLIAEPIVDQIVQKLRYNVNGLNVKELIDLFCATVQPCNGMHIILDGLDECPRSSQQTFVSLLHELALERKADLKVLVTCPDEGHLLQDLSRYSRIHISAESSAGDIQSYIAHSVTLKLSSRSLTLRNESLKQEIISTLASKAHGMFLWVHFQVTDLCEAASDYEIRQILDHLPEGLYDTYSRVLKKIDKNLSKTTVKRILMWVACARRPLRPEELQEAVAFGKEDHSWDAEKIPDSNKIIMSCLGLIFRDGETKIRFAHHTVKQFLLPIGTLERDVAFESKWKGSDEWIRPSYFHFTLDQAELMAGEFCAAYLCFSNFKNALVVRESEKKPDLIKIFDGRGPVSIPAALGLGAPLYSIPFRLFGVQGNIKMPEIDFSQYLNSKMKGPLPPSTLIAKYAALEYVVGHWPWHSKWLEKTHGLVYENTLQERFWKVVFTQSLSFEFRPWGPNQHFGPYGCKGCSGPDATISPARAFPLTGLLHWAVENSHVPLLTSIPGSLLRDHLDHESHRTETLLIACRVGHETVVEYILDHLGPARFSIEGAVLAACASGKPSILKMVLKMGVRRGQHISDTKGCGTKAIQASVKKGNEKIAEILLSNGVDASDFDPISGMTAIHIAAMEGRLEILRAIIKFSNTESLNHRNWFSGMTALHYAAANGNKDAVILLIRHGASVHNLDQFDSTPLIEASRHGHSAVVKFLLELGANPNAVANLALSMPDEEPSSYDSNDMRPTAIHLAAVEGYDDVLAVLPNLDISGGVRKACPLRYSAAYGRTAAVMTLLSRGANINGVDNRGWTALIYASKYGHDDLVRILLDEHVHVDGAHLDEWGTLYYAAAHGPTKTLKAFTEQTQKLRAMSEADHESTFVPLHIAAAFADPETINASISNGADIGEEDSIGKGPLIYAIINDRARNVLELTKLGTAWSPDEVFLTIIEMGNEKLLQLLLNRFCALNRADFVGWINEFTNVPLEEKRRYHPGLWDIIHVYQRGIVGGKFPTLYPESMWEDEIPPLSFQTVLETFRVHV